MSSKCTTPIFNAVWRIPAPVAVATGFDVSRRCRMVKGNVGKVWDDARAGI